MLFRLFLILSILFSFQVSTAAQKPAGVVTTVDELLFDMGGDGRTNFDFKIFEEVSKSMEKYFSSVVVKSFENNEEFYLFSCLALREADQLDIQADPEKVERFLQSYKFPDNSKKAEAMRNELKTLFRVAELVTIKERQLQNRPAIIAWLVVLKRKYSLGWKSNDFKSRIRFGI
ncbi:hypothetical protein CIK05_10315 [Bdellovibrio sp. qaytius]|nr:hypothetical protein CIK05_10315 [Bdellovibrio sp. qaytius]